MSSSSSSPTPTPQITPGTSVPSFWSGKRLLIASAVTLAFSVLAAISFRTTGGVSRSALARSASHLPKTPPADLQMRTPVYFLSHGGPNIMYDHEHPAYHKLGEIGREITTQVRPRAVVVFSAHWQAGRDTVQVNTAELTDLIYDFYGFPSHYYKETYPNVGSREVANRVLQSLQEAGIKAEGVNRGLDHGVWASFKCAFPEENPLNVPIVQVSLFKSEDPLQHMRLGQAVSKLRDENILIIVSGMAVHNLRDMQFTWGDPRPLPYTVSFDEALKDAVMTAPGADREKAMAELLKRPDARQAHPHFDHLLPIHVGAGAAANDAGKRLWTFKEGSMSWAQYRFGEIRSGFNSTL